MSIDAKAPAKVKRTREIPLAEPVGEDEDDEVLRWVRVDEILPDSRNMRVELPDIDELADSIKEAGLIEKIVLRIDEDDHYRIVAGHRRHAAVKKLGWTQVQCIVRKHKMRPAEVVAAMLIENGQRRDLDPIEEAHGLVALRTMWDVKDLELARRIGRSQAWVSGRVALLSLTPDMQQKVRKQQMGLTQAVDIGRQQSGRKRPGAQNKKSGAHLGFHHPLSNKAQALCTSRKHKRKGVASVGGIACGKCWEEVIRANERENMHKHSVESGQCVICDNTMNVQTPEVVTVTPQDVEDADELPDLLKGAGPCLACNMSIHDCAFKAAMKCCTDCEHPRQSDE